MASFDEAIPPGSAGTIKATVQTEGFRGVTERSITIESNDPQLPRSAIFIRVNARVGVSLLPNATLHLGRGRGGPPTASVLVRPEPDAGGALKLEGIEASVPWLRAAARPVTAPEPAEAGRPAAQRGDWVLEVALGPGAPSGASVPRVSFRTGLAVEPRVEIPVRVMLPHPVNLSSQSLLLTPAGEGLEGTVLLTVRADLDPAAMEVRADPPYAATLERAGSERALRVKVRAPAGAAPGRISFRVGTEETVLPVAPTPGPVPAS